jgi:hypothetical protein
MCGILGILHVFHMCHRYVYPTHIFPNMTYKSQTLHMTHK